MSHDAYLTDYTFQGLEDHIRHFGQTPSQLLHEPHPARQRLVKVYSNVVALSGRETIAMSITLSIVMQVGLTEVLNFAISIWSTS